MKPKIAIIDYGVGNLRSAQKGLTSKGANAMIAQDEDAIDACDAIVLPGVGAFCDAMKQLRSFHELLLENVKKKPILGICLGMQLFFEESEEDGLHKGLSVMKGRVIRLPRSVKIPQMGWNTIEIKKESRLMAGIGSGGYFYFVHSYYTLPREDVTVATTHYGVEIPAVVEKGNAYATQFHPEKSGKVGLRILENFVELAKGM